MYVCTIQVHTVLYKWVRSIISGPCIRRAAFKVPDGPAARPEGKEANLRRYHEFRSLDDDVIF